MKHRIKTLRNLNIASIVFSFIFIIFFVIGLTLLLTIEINHDDSRPWLIILMLSIGTLIVVLSIRIMLAWYMYQTKIFIKDDKIREQVNTLTILLYVFSAILPFLIFSINFAPIPIFKKYQKMI